MENMILALLICLIFALSNGYGGTKVRGRRQIEDVKMNMEVQESRRFSMAQDNRSQRKSHQSNIGEEIQFLEVVEAHRRMVSGIKYYLKVFAMKVVKARNRERKRER
ncbi:unnamed protein product [Prunus armeniaca]|nr:hypothetical protein GBA52_020146 [Prunus armeniaca]